MQLHVCWPGPVWLHVAAAAQSPDSAALHGFTSLQLVPLPANPWLHLQSLRPGPVLVHVACGEHPPCDVWQLSISLHTDPSPV